MWNAAGWFATAAGIAIFIPAFFAVRGRNLTVWFAVSLACVITEIAVVTPFGGPIGMLGTFSALAGALIWCRRSRSRILQLQTI